jgi:hypothetical protein
VLQGLLAWEGLRELMHQSVVHLPEGAGVFMQCGGDLSMNDPLHQASPEALSVVIELWDQDMPQPVLEAAWARLERARVTERDARSVEKYAKLGSSAIRAGLERLHKRGRGVRSKGARAA